MRYVNVKDFSLEEMVRSEVAEKNGIENTPSSKQLVNIVQMMVGLQLIRNVVQVPIKVNSGFRSEALNKAVGGARLSWHLSGLAADIKVPGVSCNLLWKAMDLSMRDEGITRVLLETKNGQKWLHLEVGRVVSDDGVAVLRVKDGVTTRTLWYWESLGEIRTMFEEWFESAKW